MTFMSQAQFTCTFITRTKTGTDPDGNDVYTESGVPIEGCLFAPGASAETLGSQDTVVDQPTVYAPTGSPVPAVVDAVSVLGVTYEVDGNPNQWPANPTGYSIVIKLKAATG